MTLLAYWGAHAEPCFHSNFFITYRSQKAADALYSLLWILHLAPSTDVTVK